MGSGLDTPPLPDTIHVYSGPWTGLDDRGLRHEGHVTQTARTMASAMQLATRRIQATPHCGPLVELKLTLQRVR